jgi:hypothetical protein
MYIKTAIISTKANETAKIIAVLSLSDIFLFRFIPGYFLLNFE